MIYEQIKNKKELSNLSRDRLNKIYARLKQGNATKEELMKITGANERVVRDCISYIKKFYPVISLSSQKGYRIAKSKEDLNDALHMILSETSRANDIMDGIIEIKNFVQRMEAEDDSKGA